MPAVQLPNGNSAIIYSRDEITERADREIRHGFQVTAQYAAKLARVGYDPADPTTWDKAADLGEVDPSEAQAYEIALICGLVRSWTFEGQPTPDSVLDLPKGCYDALAIACAEEYLKTEEFGPDGVTDPKAPTAD